MKYKCCINTSLSGGMGCGGDRTKELKRPKEREKERGKHKVTSNKVTQWDGWVRELTWGNKIRLADRKV